MTPEELDEVDLALAVITVLVRQGRIAPDPTYEELSQVLGISKQAIHETMKGACRKIHRPMSRVLNECGIDWKGGIGKLRPDP